MLLHDKRSPLSRRSEASGFTFEIKNLKFLLCWKNSTHKKETNRGRRDTMVVSSSSSVPFTSYTLLPASKLPQQLVNYSDISNPPLQPSSRQQDSMTLRMMSSSSADEFDGTSTIKRNVSISPPHRHQWTSLLVIACLCLFRNAEMVTAQTSSPQRRHHNHYNQRSLEQEFSGEWNGQWYADGSTTYGCNGDNCNDDDGSNSKNRNTGMWIDNVNPDSLTPEQIITYVSLGLLTFMVLLFCCVCYPELVLMGLKKLFCGCCGLGGQGGDDGKVTRGVDDNYLDGGADYVGGKQEKKERRKSKSSRTKSKTQKDVELV